MLSAGKDYPLSLPPMSQLLFRRQFLLGPKAISPTDDWKKNNLGHGLFLSTHPDLDVCIKSRNSNVLAILGTVIDALHPYKDLPEIATGILENSSAIWEVLDCTHSLAGRWLIIYQDTENTFVFSDPCGFRQAYYFHSDGEVWCGSQPEIIKLVHPLTWRTEPELVDFLISKNHTVNESVWLGDRTIYNECYHLLPNHYLDLKKSEQVRFYPKHPLTTLSTTSIVELSSMILQGIFDGVLRQYKVRQALTAGWDSRVLLAASIKYTSDIEYYVDRQGVLPQYHRDIVVPQLLAKRLDLYFKVINSDLNPPGWFISLQSQNVTGSRVLPKTRPIYTRLLSADTSIDINGNGAEICRSWYDQYCIDDNLKIDNDRLPGVTGFVDTQYVRTIIDNWKQDVTDAEVNDRNILDLLYWEQRLGNWGALYPAEKDIATEEFSPFNCRLLIDTLFSSDRRLRSAPDYKIYRLLIKAMCPKALDIPINPLARRPGGAIWKRKVRAVLPNSMLEAFRKIKKSFGH